MILGPRDMSPFVKRQMLMDAVSWSLFWEKRHEFDPFTRWQADFIRYMFGWLTQDEEKEFDKACNALYNDMTGRSNNRSNYFWISKALSKFLRRSNLRYLFDADGTMNLGSTFIEPGQQNRMQNNMSPRDFAAMLICNDKGRFQISVFVNWTWKPFGYPPTQPWDLRIGAVQGRSNQTVKPYELHHPLTFEESCCLGWMFHVTSADNRQSIEQRGLLTNPGRDVLEGTQFTSCITMTTPMDTSEWPMELLFQDTTGIQFTVSYCLRQLWNFNSFSERMG